jgi:hypothetical protein
MTPFACLRGSFSGALATKQPDPPMSFPPCGEARGRWRVAPAECPPASLDTGPVRSTAQTDHSLLQPEILPVPSRLRGFDLVTGVTSKSTMSHSYLQPLSVVVVQILR